MQKTLPLYNKLVKLPFGKYLFSKIICWTAPYFSTIKPIFIDLKPGYCEIMIRKRRAVENHIRTVHAIAIANMCELAAGLMTDVSIPQNMRWIPISMQINYLHKAKTDVRAIAKIALPDLQNSQDVLVPVSVLDTNNEEVTSAVITMRVSMRNQNA